MVSLPPSGFGAPRLSADDLLKEISTRISPQQFDTWFRNLPISFLEPNRIVITASNNFSRTWIERKFREIIAASARTLFGVSPELEIVLPEQAGEATERRNGREAPEEPPPAFPGQSRRTLTSAAGHSRHPAHGAALPGGDSGSLDPSAARRRSNATEALASAPLNRDFTFQNFVIGPSNRLAHAAALGVAEAPGHAYNPLFIHGGVGLGKTHLLHAIVHRLSEVPGLNVTYLTIETFTNHFMSAIERRKVEAFRRCVRSTGVLIVDDVQFISARERTQEEFFHTFNALVAEAKQVVISSDCPPKEIVGLKERLISRFKMGLITRVDPPSFETRVAIILKKGKTRGREIPEPVAEYIANHIVNNIRELEGAMVRLFSLASFQGSAGEQPITLELARKAVREIVEEDNPAGAIGIAEIQKAVAVFYDVKLGDFHSKRRNRTISFARQVCMYLARKLTHHSLEELGGLVGGRDHSTVHYSIKKITDLEKSNPRLAADLQVITSRILAGRAAL